MTTAPKTTKKNLTNTNKQPIMFVVVKFKSVNQIFEGIEKASNFMQGDPKYQVSVHMIQQEALNPLS